MMSPTVLIPQLNDILKLVSVSYSKFKLENIKLQRPLPGPRTIKIPGSVLLEAIEDGFVYELFADIFSQLPKDAMVHDVDGHQLRLLPGYENRTGSFDFHDCFSLVILSREFSTVPDGSIIPTFDINIDFPEIKRKAEAKRAAEEEQRKRAEEADRETEETEKVDLIPISPVSPGDEEKNPLKEDEQEGEEEEKPEEEAVN